MTYRDWRRMKYLKRAAYLPLLGASEAWRALIAQRTRKDGPTRHSMDISWFMLINSRTQNGWTQLITERA